VRATSSTAAKLGTPAGQRASWAKERRTAVAVRAFSGAVRSA
jgi:hypothetical protein